jgi:hypothetical protein
VYLLGLPQNPKNQAANFPNPRELFDNSPYAERPVGYFESGLVIAQTFGTVRNVS